MFSDRGNMIQPRRPPEVQYQLAWKLRWKLARSDATTLPLPSATSEAAQEHRHGDDIDHLGNRAFARWRVARKPVPHRSGRMERRIKEKMSVYQEMSTALPA